MAELNEYPVSTSLAVFFVTEGKSSLPLRASHESRFRQCGTAMFLDGGGFEATDNLIFSVATGQLVRVAGSCASLANTPFKWPFASFGVKQ